MEITSAKRVVYKKDGAGSFNATGESVYQNEIIDYHPVFPAIDVVLSGILEFSTRNDDIWLIDYPKSGTHWVNDILNVLLRNEEPKPFQKERGMLEFVKDMQDLEKMESPRVLNTHFRLKYLPEDLLKQHKVIYMLRNPKSVAVSAYYHTWNIKAFQYDGTFDGFLPMFIQGQDNLYGNWFDAVLEFWQRYKDSSNVLFIFYEDLKENTVQSVKKISDFLGLQHNMDFCKHVVEETKFEKMKAKETAALEKVPLVKKGTAGLYRKGTSSDWKNHFTVAQNEMFDALYEEKMKDFPDLKEKIRFS